MTGAPQCSTSVVPVAEPEPVGDAARQRACARGLLAGIGSARTWASQATERRQHGDHARDDDARHETEECTADGVERNFSRAWRSEPNTLHRFHAAVSPDLDVASLPPHAAVNKRGSVAPIVSRVGRVIIVDDVLVVRSGISFRRLRRAIVEK